MGLFGRKKKKEELPKPTNTNSLGEPLDRLTPEGELPFGWYYANKEFTDRIDNEYRSFSDALIEAKKQGVKEYRAALRSLIMYMEDVQKLCESKGECFVEWASTMVANPVVITKYKEKLKNIEENYEEITLKEQRTNYIEVNILPALRQNLIDAIKSEPGIFQVDLFKRYDADLKPYIHTELYKLELEGLLVKEKEGRRNKLFLK